MAEEFPQRLAKVVRSRRQDFRLTQAELADLAGVSERFVRFLEHGKPAVQLDSVRAVLNALGLDLGIERQRNAEPDGAQ